jgi:hypothetical protein
MSEINPDVRVPPALQWLVETCLAFEPRNRFASMNEVIKAIRVAEREIAGESGPFTMSLSDGHVRVPSHLLAEQSGPSLARQVAALDPGSSASGVSRTGVAAAGASLLVVLSLGGLALVGILTIIGGVFAWRSSGDVAPAPVADVSSPIEQAPLPPPAPAVRVGPTATEQPTGMPVPPTPTEAAPAARPVKPRPAPAIAPVPAPVPTPPPAEPDWKNDTEIKDPFAR